MRKALTGGALLALLALGSSVAAEEIGASSPKFWSVPQVGALPYDAHGRLIRRGRDLITATYSHIGPDMPDRAQRFAGNNLACGNCHLDAGVKKFGLPLFGVAEDFPTYSARAGARITLQERINSCMTRSMNGRPLPVSSAPMRAIVAYIQFLSTGVRKGEKLSGLGAGETVPELERAADPARGRDIYQARCIGCHNVDGAGVQNSLPGLGAGYAFPPLWGSDSFNDGAGMARLITAATFIHSNMPDGVDYLHPRLSPEEAWDVAALMISRPRPHRAGLEKDFPDLLQKPIDAPYGPYADGFSEEQHKFGPYGPIRAKLKEIEREKGEVRNPNVK
ncbi:c-type cytochrome [Methylocystis hirsuta]|uniref:Cystathionine gamma-synthase n=1 Tax=Methylocystis hirsuta TaxID=369798 RepID=A0A3M9XRD5_9HYPH|nr:c-type cytochrome [Methylocystis hirsuta]RNJ50395.1 cystathionine gamma-synthase [Methylocystis hirsuta]